MSLFAVGCAMLSVCRCLVCLLFVGCRSVCLVGGVLSLGVLFVGCCLLLTVADGWLICDVCWLLNVVCTISCVVFD